MPDARDLARGPLGAGRPRVIEILKAQYAHGNLELEELEERLGVATSTNSREELAALVEDLPPLPQAPPASGEGTAAARVNTGPVRESGTMLALLSGVNRKGPWKPPRELKVIAALGGVDLDFREALLPPEGTELLVFCVLGGVDIIVPPGLNVDAEGIGILGGFEDRSDFGAPSGGPTLRVRGTAILGGVDIKVREVKPPRRHRRRLT